MSTLRKIFLFIIILVVLIVGYMYISGKGNKTTSAGTLGSTTGAANVGTNASSAAQAQIGQQFLTTLLNLKNIKLDDSIFTQPSFTNLQDFTAPIGATDPEGRPNPFAPLGLNASAASALTGDNSLVPPASSGNTTDTNTGTVSTLPADTITSTTATLNGSFTQVASGTRSFEWGTTSDLGTKTTDVASTGATWNKKLTGLLPATKYYFRAVAKVGVLVFNGPAITFTTLP